jgi:DNA-binding HxlR family transcriptional regulator
VPIQVTYELTALGTELTLRLWNLITWIDDHASTILEAQPPRRR